MGVIAVGLGLAVLTALATSGDETTTTAPTPATVSSTSTFDLPFALRSDALALAQHRRDVLIGLAARSGELEIAAVRGEDTFAQSDMKIAVNARPLGAEPCGRGCFRVEAPVLDGGQSLVSVTAGSTSVTFALPRRLPPSGVRTFAHAKRTMTALHSYHFTERLSSGAGSIFTQLDVEAPNRLQLRTNNGFRSVIIGKTRWDFLDGRWQRQPFPGLDVREVLMWYRARAPRIVRRDSNGDVELAAFSLKPVPSWFRLTVEPSGRVSHAEMTAPSHFMLHRYSEFDRGLEITPPR